MQLYFFARFHIRAGEENDFEAALRDELRLSGGEEGCLSIHAFRSLQDRQLFYIHSIWKNEAAFDLHASLPHTVRFLERVETLIDHPRETTRTEMIS